MNISYVGDGNVQLIAGGGKVYTDIAARFVRSERSLEDIIALPYDKQIVQNIIESGHLTTTEFDYFIFGIEGYSRVTEVQLVRKRLASYLIKSGRVNKKGKRSFDVVIPKSLEKLSYSKEWSTHDIYLDTGESLYHYLCDHNYEGDLNSIEIQFNTFDILEIIEGLYNKGIQQNYNEEDLRYIKPQATEFKAIVGLNAHALLDWFKIRCCLNAQHEIRDLANKMLKICKDTSPDLFQHAGASCVALHYCPENKYQNKRCKERIPTHHDVIQMLTDREKTVRSVNNIIFLGD